MGNLLSHGSSDDPDETQGRSRAERWALAKRCVALIQISFPDAGLDSVLLLPRDILLEHGHMPTYKEVEASLRPVTSLAGDKHARDKKFPNGFGKTLYLSHLAGGNFDRRWLPGSTNGNAYLEDAGKAAAKAADAAGGAVAVAVAAAAVGAAQAFAGAAIAKRASAAGEVADLYATTKAFLLENTEFHYVWIASACLPPRLREGHKMSGGGGSGTVPAVFSANMFDHLHPAAMLASDAVLVVPPQRENIAWSPDHRERYTDLGVYSINPWKVLEGALAQLLDTAMYYAFRHADTLIFAGPYGLPGPDFHLPSLPHDAPLVSPLDGSRRSSAPPSVAGSENSPGSRSIMSDSPVSRATAAATGAAKAFLSKGSRLGVWGSKPDKDADESRWNTNGVGAGAEWELGTGRSTGSTGTTASGSSHSNSNGNGSRRRGIGDSGLEGSKIERAVNEALDRLGINGSGTSPERNWRSVIRSCFILRKAREDVLKFSDARGALKQAMCTMTVSQEQAKEFFGVWKYLGSMVPSAASDRLAVLNMLVYAVSLADGHCCPRRPQDFLGEIVEESLVTNPSHLDLWMKDLSPDDSRDILRSINTCGKKLKILTIGSSHTCGAGVGSFLRGHPTLKELELEWEGVRDLTAIAKALKDHRSLRRLILTHNEIGPRGASQLAEALRVNKSLTELDLRENSLGPEGMKSIARALAGNQSVRSLHLQDNAIGDDGVIAITEALIRNERLRTVCLDGNKVTDVGAKVICIAIKMIPALKLLSLSRNALPDESKRALYDAWSKREVEEGQDHSGMYLEQPAMSTMGRSSRISEIPVLEGIFMSSRGVLVSPTREDDVGHNSGTGVSSAAGNGAFVPRFSPVSDSFVKNRLW